MARRLIRRVPGSCWSTSLVGQQERRHPRSEHRRRHRGDRGAAAVEAALVLPILLFIVFGLIDFGRLLNAQITVTQAAREGARAESLAADPTARAGSAAGSLGTVNVTVDRACPSPLDPSKEARVTVTYQFDFITPVGALAGLWGGGFGGPINVTSTGVMTCLA